MKLHKIAVILISFLSFTSYAQEETSQYNIALPTQSNYNVGQEGSKLEFKLSALNQIQSDTTHNFTFSIVGGKQIGMNLTSEGCFTWVPDYSFVTRLEKKKLFQINVNAKDTNSGQELSKTIDIIIKHTNRPPIVNDLRPFYVKFNTENTYKIEPSSVYDPDNDPIVFIPNIEELPESMRINSQGEIVWKPSLAQFNQIKEESVYVPFSVEDQPGKTQSTGRVKLVATQIDLPPSINIIPNVSHIKISENQTANIRFYLSDPNGDDDISTFDFLSNGAGIPTESLIKNTSNQYEFTWKPNYDFVPDDLDTVQVKLDFFIIDKTQKKDTKQVIITVSNAVNLIEQDEKNYSLYEGTLSKAWELLTQLKEKEEELKKSLLKAKKGKKNRSIINATLGATTGLSSILFKDNQDLRVGTSTVGGTAVLTIGTLEATEVIGKSMSGISTRLNNVIEKKNSIQTDGDIFARDYALKSSRRDKNFKKSVDKFMALMNLKGLVALELDANWEPKAKNTHKAIKKTFKDFIPDNKPL